MSESQHWYDTHGNACHTIVGKNGKVRNSRITDAREHGWYPSVSGILGVMSKPELDRWKFRQITDACYDYTQLAVNAPQSWWGLDKDVYASRRVDEAFKQVDQAADAGTLIHHGIEMALKGLEYNEDQLVYLSECKESYPLKTFVEPVLKWMGENIGEVEDAELRLVNHQEGYAGTTDIKYSGSNKLGILDFKTRRKPQAYETDVLQMAAYFAAAWGDPSRNMHVSGDLRYPMQYRACNLIISTTEPGQIEPIWYDGKQLEEAYEVFLSLCKVWRWKKKYDPRNL